MLATVTGGFSHGWAPDRMQAAVHRDNSALGRRVFTHRKEFKLLSITFRITVVILGERCASHCFIRWLGFTAPIHVGMMRAGAIKALLSKRFGGLKSA